MKCLLVIFILGTLAFGETPKFGKRIIVTAGGKGIWVTAPHPTMMDWDGDSKNDLVLGALEATSEMGAYIRIYLNKGTNQEPKFDGFTHVKTTEGKTLLTSSY